ncbi:hypothetical protein E4T47_05885 [Aureobasidium subglaciale]|nr:hypothetical protein E4T47_05885 [Aureobasidium subglaciale]
MLVSAGRYPGLTITTVISLVRTSRRASGTITNTSAPLSPASHPIATPRSEAREPVRITLCASARME